MDAQRKPEGELVLHPYFLSQRAFAAVIEDAHRAADGKTLKLQVHDALVEWLTSFCRRYGYEMLKRTATKVPQFQFFRLMPKDSMYPPTQA